MRGIKGAWALLLIYAVCFCGCATGRQGRKLADMVGTFVWQGQPCAVFRGVEPMLCNADLGVPDDQVPEVRACEYTLTKMGTQIIGLSGVYPIRVGDGRILIPRRHVERFLQSSSETQTFKLTDP